jgi:RecA/RadA recombinase
MIMPFSSMARTEKIIDLRNRMAMRFPQAAMPVVGKYLVTGLGSFDQSIGGGLPKGAITELISSRGSAGSASLIHAFIHGAYRDQYLVALIDGRTSFDPSALSNSILHQLLWVRCVQALEGVKAADLLLRDGNFPLVILDLILNPPQELRKIPQTTWYRLQRLVESMSTACLVLTRYEMVSSAQLKVVLENSWNLESLEKPDAISQLRVVVKRSHLKSRIHPCAAASSGQS